MNDFDPNKEWDGGEDGVATATLPPVPAPQAATAVEEQPVPSDYNGLMAEHKRLYNAIPREGSKAARAKLTERHGIVKSRLAALQNGPAVPSIGAGENALVEAGRRNRHVHRATLLDKLRAAKAAFESDPEWFLKIEAKPLRPVSPVIAWLLSRNPVLNSIAWIRQVLTTYEIQRLEQFGQAYPVERLAEIKSQLTNCTEQGVIRELQNEAATLSLPTAATTARNTRIALQSAWQPVEDANFRLLACCQMELEAAREDSVAAERILFETHPLKLPHEPTSASRVFDPTINHIEQLLQPSGGLAMPELTGRAPNTSVHTALTSLLNLGVLADDE